MEPGFPVLVKTLGEIAKTVLPFLTLAAGAGVASMAIIQVIKEVGHLGARYQQWRVERWLVRKWSATEETLKKVLDLASGGNHHFGFFTLDAKELSQRLRLLSRFYIADPNAYKYELIAFTEEKYALDLIEEQKAKLTPQDTSVGRLAAMYADRKIDALEISLAHWWTFGLRMAATFLSALIISYAICQAPDDKQWDGVATFIISIVGGVIAPVAKDLVSAIEGLRPSK